MTKQGNHLCLKKFVFAQGADLFGVADITAIKPVSLLPEKLLAKFGRAAVLGVRLSGAVLEELETQPTRLYFHHYRAINTFLDQLALRVTNFIQAKGFLALPVPASQIVDWQNQKAHLSHKEIAYSAGLGWLGRNNLLVNARLGSQLRLVTILTDMPLEADKPVKDNCGSCHRCVECCPAKAIKDSPQDFNHEACFQKLKEFQKQRLTDQYICGVCVKACIGDK